MYDAELCSGGDVIRKVWKARNLRIGRLNYEQFWAAQVTVPAVTAQANVQVAESCRNFQLTQNGSHVTSHHSISK